MADDLAMSSVAPADTNTATPVASVPQASSGPDGSAAPAPTPIVPQESPQASTAQSESTKAAETPVDTPVTPPKSLLSEAMEVKDAPKADASAEVKDAPKPEVQAKDAPKPDPVAPEPIKFEYKLPEALEIDEAGREKVGDLLNKFVANPKEPANVQALVDYHAEALTTLQKKMSEFNRNWWSETRKEWRKQVKSDEQLGGAGFETTQAAVARLVDLGVPQKDRREFETFLETTGAGDNPAFWRFAHNLIRFYDESPQPPPNSSPPADVGKNPNKARRLSYQSMGDK